MSYAGDHASAYADVAAAGTLCTFVREQQGAETVAGTVGALTRSTIPCAAFAQRSSPERFAELGLTLERAVTLFVAPAVYPLRAYTAEFIRPNDTVVWNGVPMTVRAVGPLIAVDGTVVAGAVVASV